MQTVISQAPYWDRVADEKRFSHPLNLTWLQRYSKQGACILDYGCGYGRTLAELSQAGFENLVGADFSQAMLTRAAAKAPHSMFIRNDGYGLPFHDDCFDAVLLFAVLTCIPDGEQQLSLLAETERVLKPGGLLYLSDLLVNDDERNRERYARNAEKYKCYGVFELPEGVVVRHHSKEWIAQITSSFQQLEYEPFTVITMNGNAAVAFQYLGRKSEA